MVLPLNSLNRQPPVLLTDLYELTMAYAFWKSGQANKEAVFTMSFRHNPFDGGFAVFCGLTHLIDYISNLSFHQEDLDYLSGLKAHDDSPLFEPAFISYLARLKFDIDVCAVEDGTIVFAHEPLIRVSGPIIPCQIIETAILNLVGFPTLIATKAARVKFAAGRTPVYEFGLRRAQGMDGGITASLASYLGGCDGTSNTLAGKIFGIPVKGTHAHSWIMAHESEKEAFQNYAEAMPNNCFFLVDTYDTLNGVKNAIEMGRWLEERGHKLLGVRLDSGDLAYLSVESRKLLDEAGFTDALIMASNDLDENIVSSLIDQGAQINAWAVGTKLVTADDQPALGGVYKLSAVRDPGEKWRHVIKLSEQVVKISNPGTLQVRRFFNPDKKMDRYIADMIFEENSYDEKGESVIVDPLDFTRRKKISKDTPFKDLLVPIFKSGKLVYEYPGFEATRNFVIEQMEGFHAGVKRLMNPHQYPVGLEKGLHQLKTDLILKERGHLTEEASTWKS